MKSGNWKFGAALQTEKQDGDSFDQYQGAIEYKAGPVKLQAAIATDKQGDNTGIFMVFEAGTIFRIK